MVVFRGKLGAICAAGASAGRVGLSTGRSGIVYPGACLSWACVMEAGVISTGAGTSGWAEWWAAGWTLRFSDGGAPAPPDGSKENGRNELGSFWETSPGSFSTSESRPTVLGWSFGREVPNNSSTVRCLCPEGAD